MNNANGKTTITAVYIGMSLSIAVSFTDVPWVSAFVAYHSKNSVANMSMMAMLMSTAIIQILSYLSILFLPAFRTKIIAATRCSYFAISAFVFPDSYADSA